MFHIHDTEKYLTKPFELEVNTPSENIVLWQTMRVKHFYTLLQSECLYLKRATSYSKQKYGERDMVDACIPLGASAEWRNIIESAKASAKSTYISCWYTHPVPTDLYFKEYGGKTGVAISMTVGKLHNIIHLFESRSGAEFNFHCGAVQYVHLNDFVMKKEIAQKTTGGGVKVNTVVPRFFKQTNKSDDREYRIIAKQQILQSSSQTTKPPTYLLLPLPEIESQISMVAFKSGMKGLNDILERCKQYGFTLDRISNNIDAYDVFTFKRRAST